MWTDCKQRLIINKASLRCRSVDYENAVIGITTYDELLAAAASTYNYAGGRITHTRGLASGTVIPSFTEHFDGEGYTVIITCCSATVVTQSNRPTDIYVKKSGDTSLYNLRLPNSASLRSTILQTVKFYTNLEGICLFNNEQTIIDTNNCFIYKGDLRSSSNDCGTGKTFAEIPEATLSNAITGKTLNYEMHVMMMSMNNEEMSE